MNEIKRPAGFWIRLGANVIDGILFAILGFLVGLIGIEAATDGLDIISLLYGLLLPVVWQGYTLGKKALNIQIKRLDGKKISFATMFIRSFGGGLVYVFTLGIGLIVSAFMVGLRNDKRAIHDLIAGTYVAYSDEISEGEIVSNQDDVQ